MTKITNTKKKGVIFIIEDWKAKVGSQDTWSIRKLGLGIQNEAGKRLMEFCQ